MCLILLPPRLSNIVILIEFSPVYQFYPIQQLHNGAKRNAGGGGGGGGGHFADGILKLILFNQVLQQIDESTL